MCVTWAPVYNRCDDGAGAMCMCDDAPSTVAKASAIMRTVRPYACRGACGAKALATLASVSPAAALPYCGTCCFIVAGRQWWTSGGLLFFFFSFVLKYAERCFGKRAPARGKKRERQCHVRGRFHYRYTVFTKRTCAVGS